MAGETSYAQALRAIGQALETLKIEKFALEEAGESFLVRGAVTVRDMGSDEQLAEHGFLRHFRRLLPGRRAQVIGTNVEQAVAAVTELDLCYTWKDVDRLEQAGRARRVDPQGMANAASLSQIFRTIGAYLNQKHARLLKISRSGEPVTVVYETPPGSRFEEVFAVSDLYDFWLRMYMKRAARNAH